MVPSGMVRYPVDQYFKTQRMSLLNQPSKIIHCTKFRIGTHIVGTGIITPQYAQAAFLTNRCHRHEPEYFHTHIPQPGQVFCKSAKAAFFCILTQVYFCLLYTSDAADEEDSVDLGGRR